MHSQSVSAMLVIVWTPKNILWRNDILVFSLMSIEHYPIYFFLYGIYNILPKLLFLDI